MKKLLTIYLLLFVTAVIGQTTIEGAIYDKVSSQALPYATIKYIDNPSYTISNEDGKFIINTKKSIQFIEVRSLGYITQRFAISKLQKNPKIYLTENVNALNTVQLGVKKDKYYAYNLLFSVIKKYRQNSAIQNSKTYLTLSSSSKGIPIEHVEGFYNSSQSLAKGIETIDIKSGRFGQNKKFPFYSLNNTTILKDFSFFKNKSQILPQYPGNLSLALIKSKYKINIEDCKTCSETETEISFFPKKSSKRLFSGKFIIDKNDLVIKKIDLIIVDPKTKKLSTIGKEDTFTPKKIKLSIVFNPLQIENIQFMDFTFIIDYHFNNKIETIESNTFLYFYDYDNPFETPYFTRKIKFNNDYDKIIGLQATNHFWEANTQFPDSYAKMKAMKFLQREGFVITNTSTIPVVYTDLVKPSVMSWNKTRPLQWKNIKSKVIKKEDPVSYTSSDFFKVNKNKVTEQLNFSYMIDVDKTQNKQFITRTLFDRKSSSWSYDRTNKKLQYINLIFDIYEVYRKRLAGSINDKTSFRNAKIKAEQYFNDANFIIKKMKDETNLGDDFQVVSKWKKRMKQELDMFYIQKSNNSKTDIISSTVKPIQKSNSFREKVFIHTNRTTYFSDENVWFSAYVVNDESNQPSIITTNLTVNLLDKSGNVLEHKILFIEDGKAAGNFLIPRKYQSGKYYIQAFTNYMQNFGKKNAYIQEIEIISPHKKTQSNVVENNYDIQLFPESGYLLEDITNVIGIKALINGNSVIFNGKIVNSNDEKVADFSSNNLGMCATKFFYKKGETYTAIIKINGTTRKISVPQANKKGFVLNVSNTNESVEVTIKSNKTTPKKDDKFAFIIYRNNYISKAMNVFFNTNGQTEQKLFFEKKDLQNGVNILTFFKNNEPIAERRIFVSNPDYETSISIKQTEKTIDSTSYLVQTKNAFEDFIPAKLSLSVLPKKSKTFKEHQNIKSALLLSPYVKGHIEKPASYFNETSKKSNIKNLDILLLNQGYVQYSLDEMIENLNPKAHYNFDYGFTLSGYTKDKVKDYDLCVLSKTNRLVSFSKFDKEQKFEFKKMYFYKGDSINLSLIKKDKPLKRPKKIVLISSKYKKLKYNFLTKEFSRQLFKTEEVSLRPKETEVTFKKLSKLEQLDEVILKKVKKKQKKEETIQDVEMKMAHKRRLMGASFYEGVKVTRSLESSTLTMFDYLQNLGYIKTLAYGGYQISLRRAIQSFTGKNGDGTYPPKFYIDGYNAGSEDTSSLIITLQSTYLADIDEILINKSGFGEGLQGMGGVIKIYMKKGNHKYFEDRQVKLYKKLILKTGFDRAQKYFKPDYLKVTKDNFDLTEIDWKPNIKTNEYGEFVLKVPNNEFNKQYQFIINGFTDSGLLFNKIFITKDKSF